MPELDLALSPETERRVRLLARLGAEEALHLSRPDSPLGQEAITGARRPFDSVALDLSTAGTVTMGGPLRSLAVLSGGDGRVTLRITGYDNRTRDVPAVSGLILRDAPAASFAVVIPAGLVGTLNLAWSQIPGAIDLGGCCGEWEPDEIVETGLGNAAVDLSGEAGFDYMVESISVLMSAAGTSTARRGNLALFREDGNTALPVILASVENDDGDAHRWTLVAGGIGKSVLQVSTVDEEQAALPVRTVRFPPGQANLKLASVTYTNGVAADTLTVVMSVLRRPIP